MNEGGKSEKILKIIEKLGNKIKEWEDFRGKIEKMGIERIDEEIKEDELVKEGDKIELIDIILGDERRKNEEEEERKRRIIGGEGDVYIDREDERKGNNWEVNIEEVKIIERERIGVEDKGEVGKIIRKLWIEKEGDKLRREEKEGMEWWKKIWNEGGVMKECDEDGKVEELLKKIEKKVVKKKVEKDLRVWKEEIDEWMKDKGIGECKRGGKIDEEEWIRNGLDEGILKRIDIEDDLEREVIIGM